jgi:hypothetical protein
VRQRRGRCEGAAAPQRAQREQRHRAAPARPCWTARSAARWAHREGPRAAGWRGKVALRSIRASSHLRSMIEARLQKMSMEFRTALARAVAG